MAVNNDSTITVFIGSVLYWKLQLTLYNGNIRDNNILGVE